MKDIRQELLDSLKKETVGPLNNRYYLDDTTGEEILLSGVHGSPKSLYGGGMLFPQKCNISEIEDEEFLAQQDQSAWPQLREKLAKLFLTKTRSEWSDLMEGTDVCFAPVLDLGEAPSHPHNVARDTYVEFNGVTQPAPAPRFSRTQSQIKSSAAMVGEHTEQILADWGYSENEIEQLRTAKAI